MDKSSHRTTSPTTHQTPTISSIHARQILDSRGNPTVECDVMLNTGHIGRAAVPSGASTGSAEATELRDGDPSHYQGKGVLKAVWNINSKISDLLVGNSADQQQVDQMMIELDGTETKAALGANATLAVSLATAKAVAKATHLHFYEYVAQLAGTTGQQSLPLPMMNVMNGGAHADWSTDFQEYMIIPTGADTIQDAIRMGAEVFHSLHDVLKDRGLATTVGDEGGYAPVLPERDDNLPLALIQQAIERAGYQPGQDFGMALDIAATEFYDGEHYILKTNGDWKSPDDLTNWYTWMLDNYPVLSIEDGLAEADWPNWHTLTERLGGRVQLVGDDLFVTNTKLIYRGVLDKVANAVLIKPNQIGTLTETIEAVVTAQTNGYRTILSHRSGETEDATIAHLAVGLGTGQIKTGSLSRSERLAKYNELLRISEGNPALQLAHPFA